jgi:hypothetical protein
LTRLDPRYPDPRYPDPRYPDPRYPDPRYPDPRYPDPRYPDTMDFTQQHFPKEALNMEQTKSNPSDITLPKTEVICRKWAQLIPSVDLRLMQGLDDEVSVLIGNLDYQPVEITINPSTGRAELEDSQACYRYKEGKVVFTTAWDSEWTDITPEQGTDFESWLSKSIQKLIGKYVAWGPERLRGGNEDGEDSDYSLSQWAKELHELAQSELDLSLLSEHLSPFLPVAGSLMGALDGNIEATRELATAVTSSKIGFEDIDSMVSVVIRFATSKISEENLNIFAENTHDWLDTELKRIVKTVKTVKTDDAQPRMLSNIRSIAEGAAAPIKARIKSHLGLPKEDLPTSKEEAILRKNMAEYGALFKDWRYYKPSSQDPLAEGEAFIELEKSINKAWLKHLTTASESERQQTRDRLTFNRRFVCSATDCVLAWMRIQKNYDRAVEIFKEQVRDVELLKLRYESNRFMFEHMINSVFGAFLDSKKDEHITLALELLDTIEAHCEWQHGQCEYQIACVYARAGMADRALEMVELYVRHGGSSVHMANDEDLAIIHNYPRFLAAINAS